MPQLFVTKHNNRIYRIKKVHFDMTPLSSFSCFDRDSKSYSTITFQHYYDAYYNHSLSELGQPMLEAVPDKDHSCVGFAGGSSDGSVLLC